VRYWIANTDRKWFEFLADVRPDEVNFWQPNAVRPITLSPGAPWLFKLHVREGGRIVGGAFFAHYTTMTLRFAWDAFGTANGAPSFEAFVSQVRGYSARPVDVDATAIGSSVLVEPFFLPRDLWVSPPPDWSSNLTRGKTYDLEVDEGRRVWEAVTAARQLGAPATPVSDELSGYGNPIEIRPRLGQGAFRVMVTDAYDRRCVVTGERTLPVLQAAHIKPYNLVGRHEITNGLLLRSDLHTLFDRGYLTVTPDLRMHVSRRIHDEFENGRDYYALDGRSIREPSNPSLAPSKEMLDWHASTVFRA
jgi:Predicted restriction endonuclease